MCYRDDRLLGQFGFGSALGQHQQQARYGDQWAYDGPEHTGNYGNDLVCPVCGTPAKYPGSRPFIHGRCQRCAKAAAIIDADFEVIDEPAPQQIEDKSTE